MKNLTIEDERDILLKSYNHQLQLATFHHEAYFEAINEIQKLQKSIKELNTNDERNKDIPNTSV